METPQPPQKNKPQPTTIYVPAIPEHIWYFLAASLFLLWIATEYLHRPPETYTDNRLAAVAAPVATALKMTHASTFTCSNTNKGSAALKTYDDEFLLRDHTGNALAANQTGRQPPFPLACPTAFNLYVANDGATYIWIPRFSGGAEAIEKEWHGKNIAAVKKEFEAIAKYITDHQNYFATHQRDGSAAPLRPPL